MSYCPMPASSPVVRKGDGVFLTDIYVARAGQPYSLPDSMVSMMVGGNPVTGTAVLECAAAPAGIGVTLSSSKPAVAQPAVASLLFPQGTKSMTFQVNTSAVPASTNATIAATANGIKKSKSLTVTP